MAENEKKETQSTSPGLEKKKRTLFHKTVNVFLYIALGIIILLLLVIGITQTSTFREYAREIVLEEVNSALNGKLYIEKIEGTILTSLVLRNTALTLDKDTLFKAAVINVKTNPLQLLFKRISVRRAEIRDASISLITEENGELNISRLAPPSPEDTTTSEFPFKINVLNLSLENVSFSHRRYDIPANQKGYDSLYFDDFRIDDFNLSLSAYADINNKDFQADISRLTLNSNINNFGIDELSGTLGVNQEGLIAHNFYLRTKNSNILIDASLTDFNLFDSASDISHALLNLSVKGDKFHFADLQIFVPSVNMIRDEVFLNFESSGSLKELEISTIQLEYLSTHLSLSGKINDLDDPENMFISLHSDEAHIGIKDLNSLMPELALPSEYDQVGFVRFDTLHYDGKPANFKTHFFARTNVGNLYAQGILDFTAPEMTYDLNFRTYDFNIFPFTGVQTVVNSSGDVKGEGTDPKNMNAIVNFNAGGTIAGNRISEMQLKSDIRNGVVNYSLFATEDSTEAQLMGFIDLNNEVNPTYELKGFANNLNIAEYTGDTSLVSDINFNIEAMGESFDPEELNLFLTLNLFDSELNGKRIDSTRAIVDLRKENGDRVINVISDLADISITGNYSIGKSIKLINKEISILSGIINERISKIIPVQDTLMKSTIELAAEDFDEYKTEPSEAGTKIKYLIDLKDFELATLFLGNAQLEIDGEMFGDLINNGDSILVTFGINLEYVKYRTPESAMFLSDLNLDFRLSNNLSASTFGDISSSLNLNVDRIFAGSDVSDLSFSLDLKNNSSYFDFSANYNGSASAKLIGGFGFADEVVSLELDTLELIYKKFALVNEGDILITYSDKGVQFDRFRITRNGSSINIKGALAKSGNQDLIITIDSLSIADVLTSIMDTRPENNLEAMLNLKTHVTGTMGSPVIDLDLAIDSVTYRGRNFGSLISAFDYAEKNLELGINFLEKGKSANALAIKGNVPMEISFAGADTLFEAGPMKISLQAEEFNLGAFGDILPQINRLSGYFSASLDVTGTMDDIQQSGYIALRDVSFLAEANNLMYNTALKINIEGEDISIDSLLIQNGSDVPDGGTLTGSGRGKLDGFSLQSAEFSIGGRLKVLSDVSRYAASPVYGDLVIATRGNIDFRTNEEGMFLNAPITIKKANLTIPPTQGAYANTNRSFVYKFVQDTSDTSSGRMDFESLIAYNQNQKNGQNAAVKQNEFNYSIDLEVEDEARIIFVLSSEINQNLTAVMRGNVLYESNQGRSDIQGELKLLEGSTLEFIKTFQATGSIRFESDLTNPFLNITATYRDYYSPSDSTAGLNEIPVAVKIKIRGLLKDLDKNFVKEENNIAVYYGEEAIEEDEPDPTKDPSDAVMFIITGRFTEDLNQREQSAASSQFTGAATSIAGSVLGGVLNNYFGEYVSGVELRRVGSETKFLFSGRAGAFRYQVGGTQEVFQNISQANVRIEYPVYKGLSLRFERREDVRERAVINEMVNELGLRYRFEF